MIRIRTFRAPDDPEACEKFIAGHRAILEMYYGIIKISSDNNEWVSDPNTIVMVAEHTDTNRVYGGARVQVVGGKYPLPIETAIKKYDPNIVNMIESDYKNGGTSEICGLWNSKEVAGMGIGSRILSMVGIAIANQLDVKSMYVLCAPATVRMAYSMGLELVDTLGKKGTFYYPKDNFIATVMKLFDIHDLSKAKEKERSEILLLRNNTHQIVTETGPKGQYEVEYAINVSKPESSKT